MKIFISHRNIDKEEVKRFLGEISNEYGFEKNSLLYQKKPV
jgi:hypothetical protein